MTDSSVPASSASSPSTSAQASMPDGSTFPVPNVSPLLKPVVALAGAIYGGVHAVFPTLGMNGVDLFDRATHATPTITPLHALNGSLYSDSAFHEGQRTPGLVKTIAWGLVGAGVTAALTVAPAAAPLLAPLAGLVGSHAPLALAGAGFAAGVASRAFLNVVVTPLLAGLYGALRGALIVTRGVAAPLAD